MKIFDRAGARSRVVVVLAVAAFAGSLILGACSSGAAGGHSSNGNTTATTQIKANWSAFFNGKTSSSKKIRVLQNGSEFTSVIKSQENTQTAKSTSVKVTKVDVTSKTSAKVTYTILLGGTPALSGSVGTAVLQDKVWKVSDTSFCALLSLEGTASTVRACSSAK